MSSQENLVLYAATYADGDSARADFDDLKAAEGPVLAATAIGSYTPGNPNEDRSI